MVLCAANVGSSGDPSLPPETMAAMRRAHSKFQLLNSKLSERLIEIRDQVRHVFQPDRQSQHPFRHARRAELLVAVPPLRGEHRHADEALDAAEAGGALHDLQAVVELFGAVVPAVEIETDHAAETDHLALGNLVIGV